MQPNHSDNITEIADREVEELVKEFGSARGAIKALLRENRNLELELTALYAASEHEAPQPLTLAWCKNTH